MKASQFINYLISEKLLQFMIGALFITFSPKYLFAQMPYYFHTIHSNGLSIAGGRTVKINYMYQMNRIRQLKLSGTYIYDSYDQNRNRIKTNIYNSNIQLQHILINKSKAFLNLAVGMGGYYLSAKDILDIKQREWRLNFVTGLEVEFYLIRNIVALNVDYDIFYMPWSKIYRFMHVPTAGIIFFLF